MPFWKLVRNLIPFRDPYALASGVFVAMEVDSVTETGPVPTAFRIGDPFPAMGRGAWWSAICVTGFKEEGFRSQGV